MVITWCTVQEIIIQPNDSPNQSIFLSPIRAVPIAILIFAAAIMAYVRTTRFLIGDIV